MKFSDLAKLCGDDVTLLLLGAEHECADKAAACIKQELHAAISKRHGIGAPNTTDTTVAAARERVRIPAPKRPAADTVKPGADDVLRALTNDGRTKSRIADALGEGLSRGQSIDVPALTKVLAALVASGAAELEGRSYRLPLPPFVCPPPSGPSVDCAASEAAE